MFTYLSGSYKNTSQFTIYADKYNFHEFQSLIRTDNKFKIVSFNKLDNLQHAMLDKELIAKEYMKEAHNKLR